MTTYETVIGLEVHAQLLTRTKMFCGCSTAFGAEPNTQTCPVCQGMPGSLPVVNRRAVELGMRTALALGCAVNAHNRFARKHYYYPDIPKNYQISQYEEPLAEHGELEIDVGGAARAIGIQRLHLEEDVGKLVHEGTLETARSSQVDFNRAGVPLMEIVSKPDLRSPEEAGAYLRKLREIVRFLKVCDGNMEEGSLRCDANVSIRPAGSTEFGTKVEIKNLNSFRHVEQALEYEVRRQARALEAGERLVQETRLWDPDGARTVSMRSKEFAHDYRYFPEPDLPPLAISDEWLAEVRAGSPARPEAFRAKLADLGFTAQEARLATPSAAMAEYVLQTVTGSADARAAFNWIVNDVLPVHRARGRGRRPGLRNPAAARPGAGRPDQGRHDQRQDRQGRVRGDGGDRAGRGGDRRDRAASSRSRTPESSAASSIASSPSTRRSSTSGRPARRPRWDSSSGR